MCHFGGIDAHDMQSAYSLHCSSFFGGDQNLYYRILTIKLGNQKRNYNGDSRWDPTQVNGGSDSDVNEQEAKSRIPIRLRLTRVALKLS